MSSTSKTPLNFIHVAKCGGASVRISVDDQFNESDIFPYYYAWENHGRDRVDPCHYRFVRGHHGIEPWRPNKPPESTFLWLREPRDRIVSAFYVRKMEKLIPNDMSLRGWLRQRARQGRNVTSMIGWILFGAIYNKFSIVTDFILDSRKRLLRQDPSLVDETLEVLDRCFMVGLQERFADSMNLLHYHLASLPPAVLPRANQTYGRGTMAQLSRADRDALEEYTRLDKIVYRHGLTIFEAKYSEMKADLVKLDQFAEMQTGPENERIRDTLREVFFTKQRDVKLVDYVQYTFDHSLIGSGWQEREKEEQDKPPRGTWRWIDPEDWAEIYFPLNLKRPLTIYLGICHATARQFVEALSVRVNDGAPLQLRKVEEQHPELHSEYVLKGRIESVALQKQAGLSGIFFKSERYVIPAYENPESLDFRKLGVALNWIVLQPAAHEGIMYDG